MADKVRKSCHNKLNTIMSAANSATTPLSYLDAVDYLAQCKVTMEKCSEAHFTAIEACADDAAITVQDSAQSQVEELAHKVRVKLQLIIMRTQPSSTGSTARATSSINLPALELPTFDGSFANWTSFKDLFLATVDKHPGLSQAQKLQYLRGKLAEEPSNLIKGLLVTDGNYKEAWKLLETRYDNKREIVFSWLDKLLHHPKPQQQESSQGLQRLLDNTNECLRALEVLAIDTTSWDPIIISTLLRKVDANTRCEWATRHSTTALPTYAEFTTFLNNHIRGLIARGAASAPLNPTQKKTGNSVKSHVTTTTIYCCICKGSHFTFKCEELQSKTPRGRSELIKQHHLCYNCFNKKHRVGECTSKHRCRICKGKHHTLLHEENSPSTRRGTDTTFPMSQTTASGPNAASSHHASSNATSQVLLSTAIVMVQDQAGGKQPCRAFLDSGSQASFIAEDCACRLGLRRSHSNISISGVSGAAAGSTNGLTHAKVFSRHGQHQVDMEFHVLAKVTGLLPSFRCQSTDWSHLQDLQLADQDYHKPSRVDILIGADYYGQIIKEGIRMSPSSNVPFAQNTIFGWVLCGRVPISSHPTIQIHHVVTDMDLIKRFWEVEEPPKPRILTKEEKECEAHFISTCSRDKTGRFTVAIPFNEKRSLLGSTKPTALRRFLQVEKRLQRQPQFQQQYVDFIKEYIALGHMEEVPQEETNEQPGSTFYLPHHFVINESSSTTKLRVVFDGSMKSSTGVSLNDAMHVGATLQDELYVMLLRFRSHPIVLKTDISKMFRQFRLGKEDADMHRIFWREKPDDPLKEFRLTTVTYGTACAPNLSTRCVQQLAQDTKEAYPQASYALFNETYVDDIMSGANTDSEAIALYESLVSAVNSACLDLRKWSSNSTQVLSHIPAEHRETNPSSFDHGEMIKALGVQWDPLTDHFKFKYIPVTKTAILTKRILLSDLARVFDPLGLIACITVRAKLLLQELWRANTDWDEPIPDYIKQQWNSYQDDMKSISQFNIPRCAFPFQSTELELQGFSDASEVAYGAVIYLRGRSNNKIISRLLTSKTRVSPLRQISLPRLELMAALLLAELVTEVLQALNLNCPIYLWTDSMITLRWISASPRRWKAFVANRVAKIQECTHIDSWRHVPGNQNPADLASRGIGINELISSSFWLTGPEWLQEEGLPTFIATSGSDEAIQKEERTVPVLTNTVSIDLSIMERFSSLLRLQRVTAHIKRLFGNAKSSTQQKETGPLTAVEIRESLFYWVEKVQQTHFATEISSLNKTQQVPPSSKLRNLHPYLDQRGLLRVSGRLHNCNLSEDQKHQLILPAASHLTDLIIRSHHLKTLHGGFQLTWSSIQRDYWIPGGRNKTRFYVRRCVICLRFRSQAAKQLMGTLPESRVTPSRPFTHTGVDYAGPFVLKNPIGRAPKTYKGYLCVFVCMATKAIHLEAVSSLTSEDFIATLRRFSSRRGLPAHIYSDQGTNFVGANKELRQLLMLLKTSPQLPDQLSSMDITWHWNPPSCAHAGGLWEAGVKSAKFHLRRVIGNSILSFEQFTTILCQIEGILNSRPLYSSSTDTSDFAVLTPGHFLIGEPLIAVPDGDLSSIPNNRLNLYQQQQQRIQQFWRRWSKDYLNTLQQRHKWWWDQPNLKVGDLVLLMEDTPPGTWKRARITTVHPGGDGKVRVVTVTTASGSSLQRPIFLLGLALCKIIGNYSSSGHLRGSQTANRFLIGQLTSQ